MSTQIIVDGEFTTNISSYSVSEDATSLNPAQIRGGVAALSLDFEESDGMTSLMGSTVDLEDTRNGRLRVFINDVSGSGARASFSGTSIMQRLNSEVYVGPAMEEPLGDYLSRVFTACGITPIFVYEDGVELIPITAAGWTAIAWDQLRHLFTLYRLEAAALDEQVYVRPVRKRWVEDSNDQVLNWSADRNGRATALTVLNNNYSIVDAGLIFPSPADLGTSTVMSADASETLVTVLQTDVSMESLEPTSYGVPGKYSDGGGGRYTITDGNGVLLTADQWRALGGDLTVEIDPDNDTKLIVTLKGGYHPERAPYRVAAPDGAEEDNTQVYSTLRIHGTGVRFDSEEYEMETGVPAEGGIGARVAAVRNPFAANAGHAWDLASEALAVEAEYSLGINVRTDYINRRGESGKTTGRTYEEFDADMGSTTYAEWDTMMGSMTYAEWEAQEELAAADSFENQAFGNVAGARRYWRGSNFRIDSATITEGDIAYNASLDTTFEEFEEVWDDGVTTYEDFEAEMGDMTYSEFGLRPLLRN